MDIKTFFAFPQGTAHKRYEALRMFCYEKKTAQEVAHQFGYTITAFYSLVRDFKKQIKNPHPQKQFFIEHTAGRKLRQGFDELRDMIILLRKKYLSVADIKTILDAQKKSISERNGPGKAKTFSLQTAVQLPPLHCRHPNRRLPSPSNTATNRRCGHVTS